MREYLNAISPAMILSHAERLASLVEGTPAYTHCVELTARGPPRQRLAAREEAFVAGIGTLGRLFARGGAHVAR
jgi:hypothetical protein